MSGFSKVKSLIKQQDHSFTLFVVGPLVPERERQELSALYRKCYPKGNVIFFYEGSISNAPGATALLSERRSPGNLLDAIYVLHDKRQQENTPIDMRVHSNVAPSLAHPSQKRRANSRVADLVLPPAIKRQPKDRGRKFTEEFEARNSRDPVIWKLGTKPVVPQIRKWLRGWI